MRFLTLLLVPLLLAPVATAGTVALDLPEGDAATNFCHGRLNVCSVAPEPVRSVLMFLVHFACGQVSCPG